MTLIQANSTLRLKAPTASGEILVSPAADQINPSQFTNEWCSSILQIRQFCSRTLAELRQDARNEAIQLARKYSANYCDTSFTSERSAQCPLILAGHQPELFHPGVWFKNFLLDQVARKALGMAVNLVIDNDLCRSTAIRVPGREGENLVFESVPWDDSRQPVPWEMRSINNWSTFASFPERIQQHLLPDIADPLVQRLWKHVQWAKNSPRPVGEILAQARHCLELDSGLQTLELPLSDLVSTRSFARFSLRIMSEMIAFRRIYNGHRTAYRRANRIRSEAHPVPALQEWAGWVEGPWWVYRTEAPKRQRLFVCLRGQDLLLSDQNGWQAMIEGPIDTDTAVDQWMELLADDIFLRPRALLTTMYVRMCVGDLFIHGIGGGKYDEVTNAILTEFFGCAPPPIIVATATMHLPVPTPHVTESEVRDQQANIWQLQHHPDRFVDAQNPGATQLLERHRALLENVPQKGHKWKWHRELTEIQRALTALLAPTIADKQRYLDDLLSQLRIRQLLQSREFSYCIFPSDLKQQLKLLAQQAVRATEV